MSPTCASGAPTELWMAQPPARWVALHGCPTSISNLAGPQHNSWFSPRRGFPSFSHLRKWCHCPPSCSRPNEEAILDHLGRVSGPLRVHPASSWPTLGQASAISCLVNSRLVSNRFPCLFSDPQNSPSTHQMGHSLNSSNQSTALPSGFTQDPNTTSSRISHSGQFLFHLSSYDSSLTTRWSPVLPPGLESSA